MQLRVAVYLCYIISYYLSLTHFYYHYHSTFVVLSLFKLVSSLYCTFFAPWQLCRSQIIHILPHRHYILNISILIFKINSIFYFIPFTIFYFSLTIINKSIIDRNFILNTMIFIKIAVMYTCICI